MANSKREKELARMRAERQAARRAAEQAQRKQRNALLVGVGAIVLVVAVVGGLALTGGDDGDDTLATDSPTTPAPAPTDSPEPTPAPAAPACGATQPPAPVIQTFDAEPPLTIDTAAAYTMTIVTSCGTIEAELLDDVAPRTVNSFAFLAGEDFFDGIPISRLTDSGGGLTVAQLGDQEGTGRGGAGYTIPDENLEGATYPAGTLAMANTGAPDSGGSQFFLVAEDATVLGPTYTPFGTVTTGLDVLQTIIAVGNDGSNPAGGGAPLEPIYIEDLTVTAS